MPATVRSQSSAVHYSISPNVRITREPPPCGQHVPAPQLYRSNVQTRVPRAESVGSILRLQLVATTVELRQTGRPLHTRGLQPHTRAPVTALPVVQLRD